jgi:universal stress protein E
MGFCDGAVMLELKSICVGVDFSPESKAAVNSAANLARVFDARLLAVSVVQPPPLYQRILTPVQSQLLSADEIETRARDHLRDFLAGAELSSLACETDVRVGVPFVELIAAARTASADLLVVGAKRRGGIERLFLGGTAEQVLRKATIPVLAARETFPPALQVILAPTDFSAASRPAVQYAIELARRFAARLILLHVVEPVVQAYTWHADPAAADLFLAEPKDLEPEWEAFLGQLDLAGVRWEQRTVQGYAAPMIVGSAVEMGVEMISLGTHGRTGLMHVLLGSVAERVAREASCPVLSIRPEGFRFSLP